MFESCKSRRCERTSAAAVMIAQALVWGAVMIAVAVELRGTPAADSVTMWLSVGAFTSIMLTSLPGLRPRRDDNAAS
ncbi:MAG TPA: hypothetical protein VFD43_02190 [Planctomycetota bacterium]|nr:hypothetical protein [Planctomycetota bacterium]